MKTDICLSWCVCRAPFSSLYIIPQYSVLGVPPSHVLRIINGNIVALCGIDLSEESQRQSENISNLRVLMQKSPLCTCYGFGKYFGCVQWKKSSLSKQPV